MPDEKPVKEIIPEAPTEAPKDAPVAEEVLDAAQVVAKLNELKDRIKVAGAQKGIGVLEAFVAALEAKSKK